MEPWLVICLLWLLFAGTHLGLSSVSLRPRLIRALGAGGFAGLYSAVALATFLPIVWVYLNNLHSGPFLWSGVGVPALRWFAFGLSVVGIAGAAAGAVKPSPVGFVPGMPMTALGMIRITRHPLFMFAAVWALAHCLLNGFASDLAFFGGFVAFCLVGCAHQDARKLAEDPERFGRFMQETSFLPFVAILTGRNRLVVGELPWLGIVAGVVIGLALYAAHGVMFR